ncbi:nuclear transport factor 2 family protein [Phytohabitans rumicis]|uniref:SnoaL-like domain-containing protein n=1 Tax=Phytohabitans rumicis TaxID=1076125 RepID=A0A6V8KXA8_9ACTN|nr:nuclear transport factor 2 family protein [Phytohabitans rumicis]GFJ86476.1 hypothetical protein Prum_001180 [Phytohabitans rumicis]
MVLREYLACMDSSDPDKALDWVEPDFQFLIALPGREVTGRSRDDFAAYIAGRAATERVHHVLRAAADGDFETVYGVVTDAGERVGAFHSAAVVSPAGRMARYQAYFSTSFELFE